MTVAQLQELLANFDPNAEVYFGYPCTDNYGNEYQNRTQGVLVNEVISNAGTVAPILFLDGSEELED